MTLVKTITVSILFMLAGVYGTRHWYLWFAPCLLGGFLFTHWFERRK